MQFSYFEHNARGDLLQLIAISSDGLLSNYWVCGTIEKLLTLHHQQSRVFEDVSMKLRFSLQFILLNGWFFISTLALLLLMVWWHLPLFSLWYEQYSFTLMAMIAMSCKILERDNIKLRRNQLHKLNGYFVSIFVPLNWILFEERWI